MFRCCKIYLKSSDSPTLISIHRPFDMRCQSGQSGRRLKSRNSLHLVKFAFIHFSSFICIDSIVKLTQLLTRGFQHL